MRTLMYVGTVGPEHSKGLQGVTSRPEKLSRHQLPDLPDALSLATAMGISLSELRFLTFTRPTSTVSHYQRFEISKKTGGARLISAPMPRLKRTQYWILDNLLNRIALPDSAHGFVVSRSILTNARPHVGAKVVINLDLKDFFPTITHARVKGLFLSLGYSEQVATLLALLCSEPETDMVRLDGKAPTLFTWSIPAKAAGIWNKLDASSKSTSTERRTLRLSP